MSFYLRRATLVALLCSSILVNLFLFSSCAKEQSPSRVKVTFRSPDRDKVQGSAQKQLLEKRKQHGQQGHVQPAAGQGLNPLAFGMNDPETVAQIDCYGVLVDYPEVDGNISCTGAFGTIDVDEVVGLADFGNTTTANLIAGGARNFYLFVLNSSQGCSSFDQVNDLRISNPFFVGESTLDVTTNATIELTGTLSTGSRITDCVGGVFDESTEPSTPIDFTSLAGWWDAADNEEVFSDSGCTVPAVASSGDVVGCLKDKSGNSHNATQATPANQPSYSPEVMNGINALLFNGSTDHLQISGVSPTSEGTMFVVFSTTGSPVGNEAFFGSSASSVENNDVEFTSLGQVVGDIDSVIAFSSLSSLNTGNPQLAIVKWNVSTVTVYVNDLTQPVSNTGTINVTNSFGFYIGASNSSGSAEAHFSGYIGEVFFYNKEMTTSELNSLIDYARAKWGTP